MTYRNHSKIGFSTLSIFAVLCMLWVLSCTGSTGFAQGVINLPQTGQTHCYNTAGTDIPCSGTGQDGDIRAGVAWPNPRFTSGTGAESECMIDNLTGLMWPKNSNLPGGTMLWNNAIDFANNLTICGHSDWRLPNVNELESLINADVPNTVTWLTSQGFSNVQSSYYWSSTTDAGYTGRAWIVFIGPGFVYAIDKLNRLLVWPVRAVTSLPAVVWKTGQTVSYRTGDDGDWERGVSWPSPRFTDHGNSTVTDNLTGLMWTEDANAPGPSSCGTGTYKTWQGALDYVKCLNAQNYLGHADWRLPNRKELPSLIDRAKFDPALPSGHPFDNVQSNYYWSSTTYAGYPGCEWLVDMWDGGVYVFTEDPSGYVWPVRGGVVPGATDHFDITANDGIPIANQTPNVPFDIRLTARNADGTVKTYCAGTVYLSSSNGNMSPTQWPLTAGGVTTISVKIGAPGGQYIQIKATGCGLSGTSNAFSVGTGCTGSIGGSVMQYKTKLTGATVHLEGTGGPYTVTSADGKYNFTDIPSGNYALWASYNEGESDRIPVYVPCNGVTKNLNVFTACNVDGKTPVLLVPSILGSTLKEHLMKSIPTLHNNGFMDPSEMEIYDGSATGHGWETLRETLRDAGYVDGCTLFNVPYDWRMRSEDAVQSYLRPAIIKAKQKSGALKVNIIAHSMGGLVARSYIQSASYQNDVDRFAMIGTPNHGSAMAYPMWDGGDPFSADIMARELPPVYTASTVYLAKGSGDAKSAMDYVSDIIEDNLCDALSGSFKWLCVVKDAMFFGSFSLQVGNPILL